MASILVAAASLAVIAGWILRIPGLTALYLPGPTLKANAALCLTCLGLANFMLITFRSRVLCFLARVLATVAAAIGGLTLSQHLFGWDLGIDQLLAAEPAGALATASPNRMGPPASTANLLLGVALLLVDSRRDVARGIGLALTTVICAIAVLPLMGYAYGFPELYSLARYSGIALITAVILVVMSIAVHAGRPNAGIASLMSRTDEVGAFSRTMLVAGVVLPFGLGWILARGLAAGFFEASFAIVAMALVLNILLVALIWRTGTQLALSSDARAATERALAESERSLREADHQKTEFLATLSHELRNPLAPIRFAVELLDRPQHAEHARQTIERQVRHLTRLVDDLLDLTRITSNRLHLHVGAVELQPLVRDALDGVSSEVQRAGHRIELEMPPESVWLQADPDRVVQILVNLLTNACRHSERGGKITIGAEVTAPSVTLYVRDAGHGIRRQDLDRVFDRFVQVGETRHGGLGIGLALVRALAELHGGSVEARSAGLGLGSEFRVHLPLGAPVSKAATAAQSAPPVTPHRVLVVDDNRDAADMLASVLVAQGHVVRVAYDGPKALELATLFRPEVGLLDIGMDGMNGYDLAIRLRREPLLSGIFLVAITGMGQEEDRRRALASGFDAHLTKPADPEALRALLAVRVSSRPPTRTSSRSLTHTS